MKAEELVWMGKRQFSQKARRHQGCDISIRKSISNNKLKARFILRNGCANVVSETEYIQFAIPNAERLYFMTGDHDTGLKMSLQKAMNADNRYVLINKERDAQELVVFAGDYNLRYDSECSLYYIQR